MDRRLREFAVLYMRIIRVRPILITAYEQKLERLLSDTPDETTTYQC